MRLKSTFTGVLLASLMLLYCGAAWTADSDNAAAMLNKGKGYYLSGNYTEAMKWYQKAAELGNTDAMCEIGTLYENGLGVPKSYLSAMDWYEKAIDKGSDKGGEDLDNLHYLIQIDSVKSLPWLQKAAGAGDSNAMCEMGILNAGYTNGVNWDVPKARYWLQKSADLGNITAMRELADLYYQDSFNSKESAALAMQWFQKAADVEDTRSMIKIAELYRYVHLDLPMTMQWYQKAAAKGNTKAMRDIAELYEDGLGITQDYDKALQWLGKAVDAGDTNAMVDIGKLYRRGPTGMTFDYGMALSWFHKAADEGNSDAMYNIGCMYWYGEGVMRDEDQGMRWLIRADDAGSMEASILLESLTRDKHYMWKGEMVPHAILN